MDEQNDRREAGRQATTSGPERSDQHLPGSPTHSKTISTPKVDINSMQGNVVNSFPMEVTESKIIGGCEDTCEEDLYEKLHPGRRLTTKLGSNGSLLKYTVIILDAKGHTNCELRYGVFLVNQARRQEWLFSSIEGQWQVAETSKASRLILVTLDVNKIVNDIFQTTAILSPLVKSLLPLECRGSMDINYLGEMEGNEICRRIVAFVKSPLTGSILVENVAMRAEKVGGIKQAMCFRQLCFRRNPNMVQSEARLVSNGVTSTCRWRKMLDGRYMQRNHHLRKKMRKVAIENAGIFEGLMVDHTYLCNPYHEGMIAAFDCIANHLERWLASKQLIRSMIVGLGAGLLPMFVHGHFPFHHIQVVELDPVVGELAKRHFGFIEDDRMKLQIGDGVAAVEAIAAAVSTSNVQQDSKLHILMIDTDSEDPRNGLSCPAPVFMEERFLQAAREALFDDGILIVNVVFSRPEHHVYFKDQLKRFFKEVYEIEVEKDHRVLIAMPQPRSGGEPSDFIKLVS